MTHQIDVLQAQRTTLLKQITELGDFRPGRLYSTYRKCGKPSCHCAAADSNGHGPYWILSRKGPNQRQVSHNVPQGAVDETREQLQLYQQFRELTQELVEVNDALCQLKLGAGRQKKTSLPRTKKHSQPRSPPKRLKRC